MHVKEREKRGIGRNRGYGPNSKGGKNRQMEGRVCLIMLVSDVILCTPTHFTCIGEGEITGDQGARATEGKNREMEGR